MSRVFPVGFRGRIARALSAFGFMAIASTPGLATDIPCQGSRTAFPTSRIVEIEASNGPIFGVETRRTYEPNFLNPKEVVLTFDDGPLPLVTRSILRTLKDNCANATFFAVGEMAIAFPEIVKEIIAEGHTMATHTMTHPFNLHKMHPDDAHGEIDRGFAAVTAAARQPIAPFFRFTGLADSNDLLNFLRTRQVAAFSVDVISNDSYTSSAAALTHNVLNLVAQTNGGIILFHDIKKATAEALPAILKGLRERGYTLVHLRPMTTYDVPKDMLAEMAAKLEAETRKRGVKYGPLSVAAAQEAGNELSKTAVPRLADLPITKVYPPARERSPSYDYERAKPKIKSPDVNAVSSVGVSESKKSRTKRKTARATQGRATVAR